MILALKSDIWWRQFY